MADYKLILIHMFNFLDAVFTLIVVSFLGVEEVNPIMRSLLTIGPLPFLAFKFFLVTFSVEYLNIHLSTHKNLVFTGLLACFTSLTAWHVFGVSTLLL